MITIYDHEDSKLYEIKKLTSFLIDDDFLQDLRMVIDHVQQKTMKK